MVFAVLYFMGTMILPPYKPQNAADAMPKYRFEILYWPHTCTCVICSWSCNTISGCCWCGWCWCVGWFSRLVGICIRFIPRVSLLFWICSLLTSSSQWWLFVVDRWITCAAECSPSDLSSLYGNWPWTVSTRSSLSSSSSSMTVPTSSYSAVLTTEVMVTLDVVGAL